MWGISVPSEEITSFSEERPFELRGGCVCMYVCMYLFFIIFLQHAPLQIVILHAWNDHHKHCVFLFDCLNLLHCYRYFSLCPVLYVLTYFIMFGLTHCVYTYLWITYFHSQLSL
jgi:hypothetical protein